MRPKAVMFICLLVSAVVLLSLIQTRTHCNSASRMATVESLVDYGTFSIDSSAYVDSTADKVMIDGSFYSSKPPMLSFLASGSYFVYREVTGMTLAANPGTSIAFINVIMGVIPYLLTVIFFYLLVRRMYVSDRTVILAMIVFTFNFIGLGYATDFNNHTPAALCLLVSFYLAYSIRTGRFRCILAWISSGFMAGLASTLEFWGGFFGLAIAVYLLGENWRRGMLLFIPAAALPVLGHFILNHVATGSLLPVYLRPELYQYATGYWTEPTGIDAINESKPVYFFNILLGHHGLFSMTPVLLLGGWSIARKVRVRSGKRREALTIGLPVVATIIFLGLRTRNYGGVCAGLRWMILAMPLMFVFVAEWIDNHRGTGWMVLLSVLFIIGLVMLADVPWANAGPWHNSAWHKYVFGIY